MASRVIAATLHLLWVDRFWYPQSECFLGVERCGSSVAQLRLGRARLARQRFFTQPRALTTVLHRSMRDSDLRFAVVFPSTLASLICLCACQDFGSERRSADPASRDSAAQQAEQEARELDATRREAEEKAKQERERAAQAALEEKKKEEALRSCCQALAKTGFEERSMELMAATDVCEAAQKEQKTLEGIRDELMAPLGKRSLPAACGP